MSKYLDIQGLKTYTKKLKAYIDSKVSGVDSSLFEPVASLPADISAISTNKIYLVALDTKGDQNKYAEYIYTGKTDAAYSADNWEKLGEYNAGSAADVEKDVLTFEEIVDDAISVKDPTTNMAGSVVYSSVLRTFVWKGATLLGGSSDLLQVLVRLCQLRHSRNIRRYPCGGQDLYLRRQGVCVQRHFACAGGRRQQWQL